MKTGQDSGWVSKNTYRKPHSQMCSRDL